MTDALALQGGRPSVPDELIAHDWERYRKARDDEVDAVTAVLRSGHLSIAAGAGMPQADALEEEFARWVGTDHCLAVNTGTASLHCAVAGVGVEAGDQVIVPAYTFIASAMVVLQHNAIPVFVDNRSAHLSHRSGQDRGEDHGQDPRHHGRASARPAGRHGADRPHRQAARTQGHRRRGAGLRRPLSRQEDRCARRCGRLRDDDHQAPHDRRGRTAYHRQPGDP